MKILLKGNEVAERLGISRSKAYSLMKSGKIRTVRFDGVVRVEIDDLEIFIDQNKFFDISSTFETKLAAGTASDRKPQSNEVFHE